MPLRLAVLACCAAGALAPARTMIAVNAGGPSFVGSDEAVYEADRYHAHGEASDFGIQFPISGTKDPELYQVRAPRPPPAAACRRAAIPAARPQPPVLTAARPPRQTERYAISGQVADPTPPTHTPPPLSWPEPR